jgi:hypothetical protein
MGKFSNMLRAAADKVDETDLKAKATQVKATTIEAAIKATEKTSDALDDAKRATKATINDLAYQVEKKTGE